MDSVPRAALTPLWLFRNCRHCLLFMLNQAIFPPIAYVAILFGSKLRGKVRGTGLVRHERWGGRRRTGQGCLSQAAGVRLARSILALAAEGRRPVWRARLP